MDQGGEHYSFRLLCLFELKFTKKTGIIAAAPIHMSPPLTHCLFIFVLLNSRVKERKWGKEGIRKKNPERVWAPGNYY